METDLATIKKFAKTSIWDFFRALEVALSEFRHNHHPSGVKILAKFIRRGIRV